MVIKSLAQTLKDLATGIKNTITGVTGSNATLTIIKGNGTTSTVTVNNVANATNATKATQDSAGQQINTTYIKGLSISGKTITYTKGDGTTGTITTQDTTYTHPNSGVTAGTYKSVTVNAQGHVTAGSNPTTLAGYGITDASLKGHTHSQYLTASSDLNVNKLKGVISLDNLPAGTLERLVKVTNDTARFALTTNDIQLGDTVKVESTKMMYIVKDITKLNSEDGYEQYTAGMASSVPWSGVTGKPSSYTPSAHTHDDRYYTESEINSKVNTINSSIDTKADKTHTHDDRYYTESEIDSKVNTINTSINNKSDKTHTHDDRYYTESEINTKLSGKSDTSHTHNYLPLAGGTTTGKVNMKSANLDNLPQIFRTDGVNFAGIRFQNTNGYLGAIGITGNVNNVVQRLGSDGNLYPILDSSNYNNYAPTKTGGGASGTWDINVSGNSATATKATQDSAGQQINTTYIKGLSVSGKTITYTKGNGSTGTITTQDTAYSHPNSGVSAGTYKSVTVNAQGHVTGGSNPTTLAGYGITDGVFRYALGSTADKSVYTMFAGCPADAGSGNISATVLLTQGGNFGGAYQGAWLIQISTRGGKYMSVKTLRSASSSPTFGYYVSGSTCYFGALFPAYRGDCNVTVLSSTGCTLKDLGDTTTAPSGWTAVTPELMLDSGNYNSYAPTKTGDGASGTWGINISGNAASANKLATARAISLTGNASGSANFDGSGNISINTTVSQASVADIVHKAIQPRGVYGHGVYIFYGTLIIPQLGDFFKLEVLGGSGHNSEIGQSREGTLYFRTGNGSPAHYAAYSEYHRNGAGNFEFFVVKDSGTKYRIYSGVTNFTGTMQVIPYVGENSSFYLALTTVSALPDGAVKVEQQQLIYASTINNYAPTKTGGGASGTWGINITGNADNATKWNGLVNDYITENNIDTWIPVFKDGKLQHTTKANMIVGRANTAGTADTSKSCSGNSATATKATQDSAGQQINTTYIKGLSISGRNITYTKGNGTTGTITTQDTVYTLPAASSSTLGGIKMSYGTNDLSAGSSSLATGALYFVYE